MKKRRALVTGGSRGIGKAISLMLAENGIDLLINFNSNTKAAEETKNEVEKHNVECRLLQFDISDFDNTKKVIDDEVEKNGPIDILIHNAGIRKDVIFPLMAKEDWDSVIDTNYKSFFYVVKPVINGMIQQKFGKIVIISSTAGLTGMPGQVNYASSKFGVIGAAKSLAVEVARKNVNVNIIAPGLIDTEMTQDLKDRHKEFIRTIPSRRIGNVEDISNVVEFLISEKSSYIVGQVIPVNGGVVT